MCFYYLAAAPLGAVGERVELACYDYDPTLPENEPVFFCFDFVVGQAETPV